MCGISAIVDRDRSDLGLLLRRRRIDEMVQSQQTRGPDGAGIYESGSVALGHNLLKILPCPHSAQPFTTADGALTIVFNGEIYNFRDLRRYLVERGTRMRSFTDTETILELYRCEGVSAFARLRGMFALVLHDRRNDTIVAARDRSGQKPIYVRRAGSAIYIASTLAALRVPSIGAVDLNQAELHCYLWTLMPRGNSTLLAGIDLIEPGGCLILDGAGSLLWAGRFVGHLGLDAHSSEDQRCTNLRTAAEEFRSLLRHATAEQIFETTHVAGHLSGGLDSSAIMQAATSIGRTDVTSYSCSYAGSPDVWSAEERGFEEAFFAKLVAAHLGIGNEVVLVSPADYAALLVDLVASIEEPRGNPCLPHFALARAISARHRIVLSGEGADEFFGGYPWKLECARFSDSATRYWRTVTPAPPEMLLAALQPKWADCDPPWAYVSDAVRGAGYDDRLRRILRFDQEHFLRYLLLQADRLAGRFGIEGRYPFLDDRIVQFSWRLSASLLVAEAPGSKPVLREALRDVLPPAVLARPKLGFVAPEGTWYKGTLLPLVRGLLLDHSAFVRSLYRDGWLERLVGDHHHGRANYRKLIWSLMTLEIWHRLVIRGQSRADLDEHCRRLASADTTGLSHPRGAVAG